MPSQIITDNFLENFSKCLFLHYSCNNSSMQNKTQLSSTSSFFSISFIGDFLSIPCPVLKGLIWVFFWVPLIPLHWVLIWLCQTLSLSINIHSVFFKHTISFLIILLKMICQLMISHVCLFRMKPYWLLHRIFLISIPLIISVFCTGILLCKTFANGGKEWWSLTINSSLKVRLRQTLLLFLMIGTPGSSVYRSRHKKGCAGYFWKGIVYMHVICLNNAK